MSQKGSISTTAGIIVLIFITAIIGYVIWKEMGRVEVYAPSSTAIYHSPAQVPPAPPQFPTPATSVDTANWKLFSNRAGWSIKYPPDWKISGCSACDDLTVPYISFIHFDPSNSGGGYVSVEPRRDKPATTTIEDWFEQIKATNTRDAFILSEEQITLNGSPALRVVYSGPATIPGKGYQHEIIFIVKSTKTFKIILFSPNSGPIISTKDIKNYPIYQQMLSTFRVNPLNP